MKSLGKSGSSPGAELEGSAEGRAQSPAPSWAELALEAVLETVQSEIWLVREDGRLVHASAPARAKLGAEADGVESVERFAEAMGGAQIRWLPPVDGVRRALVVRKPEAPVQEENALEHARAAWKLTRRQAEVLALLSEGKSNRLIATLLSCSERTVELHVASLFRKAGCDSRTELVAKFWRPTRA